MHLNPGTDEGINNRFVLNLFISLSQWVDREPGCHENEHPRWCNHDDECHPLHCPGCHGGCHAEEGET